MKIKSLFGLMLSTFLISCIEVRDAEEEEKKVEPVATPQIEVIPQDKPHMYAIKIRGGSGMSQITRKPLNTLKQAFVADVPVVGYEAEDVVDQPGTYEYAIQQGGRLYALPVEVPQDFVVTGDRRLADLPVNVEFKENEIRLLEFTGRLFFEPGANLVTDGENLHIKAAAIFSEGAMVQTFPANQTAAYSEHGRNGGNIKIEAQSIRGTLHFVMRGENGSNGEDSIYLSKKPWRQMDTNGRRGGNSGLLEIRIADQSRGAITFDLLPGEGGQGVELVISCSNTNCKKPRILKPRGQNGNPGIAEQPR